MAKNNKKQSLDPGVALIDRIIASHNKENDAHHIVDIITFCENPHFLNFLGQDPKIFLWPMQRIVLKMFYRGSDGNEHLHLTDDEIGILKQISKDEELDYDDHLGGFDHVIDKYNEGTEFTHLLLIMGRRSSKTMMVSIGAMRMTIIR